MNAEDGEGVEWERNEEYLLKLTHIQSCKIKLAILDLYYIYPENKTGVQDAYLLYSEAIKEISESKELFKILSILLRFGNVMNAGTKVKERADGFSMDLLEKLGTIKSNSGKNILLLVNEKMKEQDDKYDGVKHIWKNTEEISKNNISELKSAYSKLVAENTKMLNLINDIEDLGDGFLDKIKKIAENYKEQVKELGNKMKEVDAQFIELAKKLAYQANDIKMKDPEKMFLMFIRFADDLQKNMPKATKRKHEIGKKIAKDEEKTKL